MILVSSDWHCNDNELMENAKEFIRKGKALGATLVGNGDLFELMLKAPLFFEGSEDSNAIQEFKEELGDYEFYYIAGNHDPKHLVLKLFPQGNIRKDGPNVIVKDHLDLGNIHFTHGHQWGHKWFLLRHFAHYICSFMLKILHNKLWYWICRKLGWLHGPGDILDEVEEGKRDGTDYVTAVGVVWDGTIKYARRHKKIVIVGHTHCLGAMRGAIGKDLISTVFADGGTLKERTCVKIIDSEVQLTYLDDL